MLFLSKIRRKVLIPFRTLLRALLPHTGVIHYSSWPKLRFESDHSSKKNKNRFKDMEMTAGGNHNVESPGVNYKVRVWSTKKSHNLGVPFFGLGIFKGCYTLLWNHTCNDLRFFQNFQGKPRNLNGVFTKAFP